MSETQNAKNVSTVTSKLFSFQSGTSSACPHSFDHSTN